MTIGNHDLSALGDRELLRRIRAGDDEEVARTLIARYMHRVRSQIASTVSDPDAADDLVQDTFVKALAQLDDYSGAGEFGGWLLRIARNTMLDHHKRRRPALVDPHVISGEQYENSRLGARSHHDQLARDLVTGRELADRLAHLPAMYPQVLVLRYVLGLATGDIARVIGKTPAAVRQLQARALGELRRGLAEPTIREPLEYRRLRAASPVATRWRDALNGCTRPRLSRMGALSRL